MYKNTVSLTLFLSQFPPPHIYVHSSCLLWEGAGKEKKMKENVFFIGLGGSNSTQSSPFSIYNILHISAGFSEVWFILEAYSCKCEKAFCMVFNIISFQVQEVFMFVPMEGLVNGIM